MNAMLRAQGVSVSYPSRHSETTCVLDAINFSVKKGEIISFIGPSGCGKTTLLKTIIGLLPVTHGEILYKNQTVTKREWKGEISYVPQVPLLLPHRTVTGNILLPLEFLHREDTTTGQKIIRLTRLTDYASLYPHQLSGGYKQRVAIARALVTNPNLLLLDEPFSALDEFSREELNEEFIIWQRNLHTSVVFITHNIAEAVFLSDTVYLLSKNPARIIHSVPVGLSDRRSKKTRSTTGYYKTITRIRSLFYS